MSVEEFQDLIKDPDKPFFNRALQGRYPPASTIKPAIGMFGLTNKFMNWSEEIDDPGFFTLPENGRIYRGWKKGRTSKVNLKKALWSARTLIFLTCLSIRYARFSFITFIILALVQGMQGLFCERSVLFPLLSGNTA